MSTPPRPFQRANPYWGPVDCDDPPSRILAFAEAVARTRQWHLPGDTIGVCSSLGMYWEVVVGVAFPMPPVTMGRWS